MRRLYLKLSTHNAIISEELDKQGTLKLRNEEVQADFQAFNETFLEYKA
ncbi:MAG TPA: hypothetical protein VKA08_01685 [Balneolales bacterium]|jgi:hypothetical protein|nr:hypothetical protein [Balneolales bacterium]